MSGAENVYETIDNLDDLDSDGGGNDKVDKTGAMSEAANDGGSENIYDTIDSLDDLDSDDGGNDNKGKTGAMAETKNDGGSSDEFRRKSHLLLDPLILRVKWKKEKDILTFNLNREEMVKESFQPSIVQYVLTSNKTRKCLLDRQIQVDNTNLEHSFIEIDMTAKPELQEEEVLPYLLDCFDELSNGMSKHVLHFEDEAYIDVRHQLLRKSFEALESQCVICFKHSFRNDIYFVGDSEYLKRILEVLRVDESKKSSIDLSSEKWKIAMKLGLKSFVSRETNAFFHCSSGKEVLECDFYEKEYVMKLMEAFEQSIVCKKVCFKSESKNILLADTEGHINEGVLVYLQQILMDHKIRAIICMKNIKGRYIDIYLYSRKGENLQKGNDIIEQSIKSLSMKHSEVDQDTLKKLLKEKKCAVANKNAECDEVELVCTSDVYDQLYNGTVKELRMQVPLPVGLFLSKHGTSIIQDLKNEIGLAEATFSIEENALQLKGGSVQISLFKKKFRKAYSINIFTLKSQADSFRRFEKKMKAIAENHGCSLEIKCNQKDRSCSSEVMSWTNPRSNWKISLLNSKMDEIDAACKVSFCTDVLFPLQDIESDKTGFAQKCRMSIPKHYTLGQIIWDVPMLSLKASGKASVVVWESYAKKQNRKSQLKDTVKNLFTEALHKKMASVAIPLLLFKDTFTIKDVTKACLKAALNIRNKESCFYILLQTTSSDVELTDIVRCIDEYCFKKGKQQLIFRGNLSFDSPQIYETRQLVAKVELESILKIKKDVLVNTVGNTLDLESGVLSKQILKEAGDSVKEECKKHGKAGDGELIVTDSGNLKPVKKIFHCVLPMFKKNKILEDVKAMVKKCLYEADLMGYKTIVFPAFGTGNLEYPPRDTAAAMFDSFIKYKQCAINSNLKEAVVAVYKSSKDLWEAFCFLEGRKVSSENPMELTGFNGLYTCIGTSSKRVSLQVVAQEEISRLPFTFVKVFLEEKRTETGVQKWKYASEKPQTDNDQMWLYIENASRDDAFQNELKSCFSSMYDRRVTDVALYCLKEHAAVHQIQTIVAVLQEHLKTCTSDLFRDILIAVPSQQINADLKRELLSEKNHMFPSFLQSFSSKIQWNICSAENITAEVRIVGKTDEECQVTRNEVIRLFNKEGTDVDSIYEGNESHNTYMQSLDDRDCQRRPAENIANAAQGNIAFQGTDDKQSSETTNQDTEEFLKVDQDEVGFETKFFPKHTVSATVNPGITQFLRESGQQEVWIQKIEKAYNIQLKQAPSELTVFGKIEDLLRFEMYLEQSFPDDPKPSLDSNAQ